MATTALRHPALALGVVAALGAGIAAPAASAASASASSPAPASSVQRNFLTDLLAVVKPIIGTLLPAEVTQIVDGVDNLLPAQVGAILDGLSPEALTQVVTQATSNPTAVVSLLGGLVPTLTSLTGGAAGTTPSLPDATAVIGQLTSILSGGLPSTTEGQAALTGVLDQVTSLLGLPGVRDLPVVGQLVAALEGVAGQLPEPLKTPVKAVIAAAAGTPATPGTQKPPTAAVDPTLAALLALLGGAKAPAATPAPAAKPAVAAPVQTVATAVRAKITSVKLSSNRKKLTVRVTCPTVAAAGCKISPKATVAGKTLKLSGTKTLKRGKVASLKGSVSAATAKKLRAKGGKAVVRVSTTGSTSGAVSKTVTVRRAAR